MELKELIARLEQASGGDPSLDAWIWWWGAAAPRPTEPPDPALIQRKIATRETPHYTGDLLAATSLVPEGYAWRLEMCGGRFAASVFPTVGAVAARGAESNAPATALCAAALRRRLTFATDVMRGRH